MSFKRLLLISRPAVWCLAMVCYLVGVGNVARNLHGIAVIELLLFLWPFNFFLYGINDVYDRAGDKVNRRKGTYQGLVLTKTREIETVKIISAIIAAAFLIVAALANNVEHFIWAALCLLATLAYSQLRWKEIPILGSIVGGCGYFLAIALAFSLHDTVLNVDPRLLLLLLPLIGIHSITTLIDVGADRKAGMSSTGIAFGERGTALFAGVTFVIPLLVFYHSIFLASLLGLNIVVMFLGVIGHWGERDKFTFAFALSSVTIFSYLLGLIYFFVAANAANWHMVY